MKKIIILISILAVSVTVAFAQTTIPEMQSIRSSSTAGLFGSDIDDISSSGIYGLDRSFLSLNFTNIVLDYASFGARGGSLPRNTNELTPFALNAYTGVAITPSMYLGIKGGFTATGTILDETVLVGTGADNIPVGVVQTTSTSTASTKFGATVAFGLNQTMGFSYAIYRDGKNTDKDTIAKSIIGSDTEQTLNVKITQSNWVHEIGFGMKLANEMAFNVPVGIVINNNKTILDLAIRDGGETTTITGNATWDGTNLNPVSDLSKVYLYLKPDFTMPLDLGLFTQVKVGGEANFAVSNKVGAYEYTTTNSTDDTGLGKTITETQEKNADAKDFSWNIFATPTFEWNILDDNKLTLKVEPTLAFAMNIESKGKMQDLITTTMVVGGNPFVVITNDNSASDVVTKTILKPSINLPVAAVFSPVEWFELRTGFNYNVTWRITDTKTTTTTGEYKTTGASVLSTITPEIGFGFIISDDFFIDIAFASEENAIFLDTVSLQLSYRF